MRASLVGSVQDVQTRNCAVTVNSNGTRGVALCGSFLAGRVIIGNDVFTSLSTIGRRDGVLLVGENHHVAR